MRDRRVTAWLSVLLVGSVAAAGDLVVDGEIRADTVQVGGGTEAVPYNAFSLFGYTPEDWRVDSARDVFIEGYLEVGLEATVDRHLRMGADQRIGSLSADSGYEALRLIAKDNVAESSPPDNELWLEAGADNRFIADRLADTQSADTFRWYNNGHNGSNLRAVLQGDGDLVLEGAVSSNQSLDLAESFLKGGELEPGDVVRISTADPQMVEPARSGSGGTMLGVVSASPGVVLGGAPFTRETLRAVRGEDVYEEYLDHASRFRFSVVRENPRLALKLDRMGAPDRSGAGEDPAERGARVSTGERRDDIRDLLESDLEVAALRMFHADRFVQVALAGRVPVNADASGTPIRPGDPLTAGPEPGTAVRATDPGPILGTALESLDEGEGEVMMFVHRGWYGGDRRADLAASSQAAPPGGVMRAALAQRDAEIAALRARIERLERLEAMVAELLDRELPENAGEPRVAAFSGREQGVR